MKLHYQLLFILLLMIVTSPVFSQSCENTLPSDQIWYGKTEGSGSWNPGKADNLSIIKIEQGAYRLSDLSAGFFNANAVPYEIELEININCDGTVEPKSFESDFGDAIIASGQWTPLAGTLTIQWHITKNNINETSIFQTK